MSKTPALLGAVVKDLLSAVGVPSGILGEAFQAMQKRRLEAARAILLDELAEGQKTLLDAGGVDELVAILHRYARAAQEGAARLNMRLMARVVRGMAATPPLVADEFLAWADVLASLRREELILVATLARARRRAADQSGGQAPAAEACWKAAASELVPTLFADDMTMRAAACSVMRSGFLVIAGDLDSLGFWTVSPIFDRLEQLAEVEEVIREERG